MRDQSDSTAPGLGQPVTTDHPSLMRWLAAMRRSRQFGISAIGMAAIIGTYCDQFGTNAYPGADTLGLDAKLAEAQVRRLIAVLVAGGWLVKLRRVSRGRGKGFGPAGYARAIPAAFDPRVHGPADSPVTTDHQGSVDSYYRSSGAFTTDHRGPDNRSSDGPYIKPGYQAKETPPTPPADTTDHRGLAVRGGGGQILSEEERAELLARMQADPYFRQPAAYLAAAVRNGTLPDLIARVYNPPRMRSTTDDRVLMALQAGERAQARMEAEAAAAGARLATCNQCNRTVRVTAGRMADHDGYGGRRCPGPVSPREEHMLRR